ncbi:MAG: bifunctional riboflavin kinase/FAD synthetase [Candidatus Omnitrophica bacterium]|nr:bifunctional riboflavin kinase/FAD synthetase [Candidatus Omnitrophota bacterium]
MKLIKGIANLKKFKNPVLTIGIFDGVHLGHQKIITQVLRQAKNLNGTSVVVTFCPYPLRQLKKHPATALITTVEHRIDLIRYLGADVCIVSDFNKEFSRMSAEDFVKYFLVDIIGIRSLVVGERFRFGRKRAGTVAFLKKMSKRHNFRLHQVNEIPLKGKIISSSRIRRLIQTGQVRQANALLGRKFSLFGKVELGQARGRILGFPTANITPDQEIVPASGVYAVFVRFNKKIYSGVLNIGFRPTFQSRETAVHTFEAHIFNFGNQIYGRTLELFFIQRIRAEKKFASHQTLLAQIKKDAWLAKIILQKAKSPSLKTTLF